MLLHFASLLSKIQIAFLIVAALPFCHGKFGSAWLGLGKHFYEGSKMYITSKVNTQQPWTVMLSNIDTYEGDATHNFGFTYTGITNSIGCAYKRSNEDWTFGTSNGTGGGPVEDVVQEITIYRQTWIFKGNVYNGSCDFANPIGWADDMLYIALDGFDLNETTNQPTGSFDISRESGDCIDKGAYAFNNGEFKEGDLFGVKWIEAPDFTAPTTLLFTLELVDTDGNVALFIKVHGNRVLVNSYIVDHWIEGKEFPREVLGGKLLWSNKLAVIKSGNTFHLMLSTEFNNKQLGNFTATGQNPNAKIDGVSFTVGSINKSNCTAALVDIVHIPK